jgi:hypothetical protein
MLPSSCRCSDSDPLKGETRALLMVPTRLPRNDSSPVRVVVSRSGLDLTVLLLSKYLMVAEHLRTPATSMPEVETVRRKALEDRDPIQEATLFWP